MFSQSIVFPMAIKQLTVQRTGAAFDIAPGVIMSVTASGTGSKIIYKNRSILDSVLVTATPATVATGTSLFAVTPIGGTEKYIRAETVGQVLEIPGGSRLILLSNDLGQEESAVIDVEGTPAEIAALIDAAIIEGGGGGAGSSGTITALGGSQVTAAPIITNVVRIIGGTVGMGVRLDTATAGELRMITNATLVSLFVYPAIGDFIEPGAVNEPIALGAGESVILFSSLTGKWDNTTDTGNTQAVTASGTVQGGGQIRTGVTDANIVSTAFGQTAVTLPPALNQTRISVSHTAGATSARLYPYGTDQINGGGAGLSIFVPLGATLNLACDVDGNWIDEGTQMDTIFVNTISSPIVGGTISLEAPGTPIADFGLGIDFYQGLGLHQSVVTANVLPGSTQVTSNICTIQTCATEGDGVTLAGSTNFSFIKNDGAEAAFVYPPSGHYMDGVLDGYVWVNPGAVVLVQAQYDAGTTTYIRWVSSIIVPGVQSSTANAGSTQATGTRISNAYVSARTVVTPGDSYTICSNTPKEFTLHNTSVTSLDLFPMAGGTINGGAVDAAFAIAAETAFTFRSIDGLDWVVELRPGATQGAVAFATGGQANGTPIVGSAEITTVATGGDSVSIQTYSPRFFYIRNSGANALDLFPPVGGQINSGGANVALSVAAAAAYAVYSNDGILWTAILQ